MHVNDYFVIAKLSNMKLKALIFFLGLFLCGHLYAQGPPPPCGLNPYYECDIDNDGFTQFDLVSKYDFAFCAVYQFNLDPNDYYPTQFYESEADMLNETNPIANPSNYTNVVKWEHPIFFRANKIAPDGSFDVLTSYDETLYAVPVPTPNGSVSYHACSSSNPGFAEFLLSSKNEEILSGQVGYEVDYFDNYNDALNLTNKLPNTYTNTIQNQQTIYVNVHSGHINGCQEIIEMSLVVEDICQDLGIYISSYGNPSPGFFNTNILNVINEGTGDISSGTIEFSLDNNLEFNGTAVSGSDFTITETSGGFTLDFTNLNIGESLTVYISIFCPVSVSPGLETTNTAAHITSDEDVNPYNNQFSLSQIVVASYDPNDITEAHGPQIEYNDFSSDDYLFYTIRFQNVGTANAVNIRIENILDSQLDESTFEMISSSHTYSVTRMANELEWTFNNINLPYESADEPNSHGFVMYKIKPKPGFMVNDIIPNNAAIYFDFNPAVITNTFETEFIETLSTEDFGTSEFTIYPNPATNTINLIFGKAVNDKIYINIYDIQGKLILNSNAELRNNATNFIITSLKSGMYFLKLNNSSFEAVRKLIIK
jgi:hypothetical protein